MPPKFVEETSVSEYEEFIQSKLLAAAPVGFDVPLSAINPMAFDFQRDIIRHSLAVGRYALFLRVGLGKTLCYLEWARHVANHTSRPVLIAAPLAVADQTVREGAKFGYDVAYVRSQEQAEAAATPIKITNYEMLSHFDPAYYGAFVGDESSILKNFTGKTKQRIMEFVQGIHYRLFCSATPSPNDDLELGNHAEAVGVMNSKEMIGRWFINDTMKAGGYRLRKHAAAHFWTWVSSWAVCMNHPADFGYTATGYDLPPVVLHDVRVGVDHRRAWQEKPSDGQLALFLGGVNSATSVHREKRVTLDDRMKAAADVALSYPNDYMVLWVETDAEADTLRRLLPDAVEVRGSEDLDVKRRKLLDFSNGNIRTLITKQKIAAHGLNWQHCSKTVFASVSHKWEAFYQAMGRFDRYGQTATQVDAFVVHAESEGDIVATLKRKQAQYENMQREMINAFRATGFDLHRGRVTTLLELGGDVERGDDWTMYHGDSCVTVRKVADESVDVSAYSPPFSNLYVYSDAVQDMGNSKDYEEFFRHYAYLVREKFRIHKPGTLSYVHCKDLPLYLHRDEAMGLYDFPGGILDVHTQAGWELEAWKTIWKDPVIEMQRTKNAGLLWSSAFCERGERARQGMADYVLVFRKGAATTNNDRVLPMPYSVVARCVDLWSNPGDNVFSPYHDDSGYSTYIDLAIVDGGPNGDLLDALRPGRNVVCRVTRPQVMTDLIQAMKPLRMVFHSRIALTDGTWLVVFRKWSEDMSENEIHVTHDLKAAAHEFVGNDGPAYWDNDRDYSIQVWQRYASPVWFDLDGLAPTHPDVWMDIDQTNVLNFRMAKDGQDERHICPLQLDVIDRCILGGSRKGDLLYTPFAGIGSELVRAIVLDRRAVGGELKRTYFDWAVRYLRETEQAKNLPMLFDVSAYEVAAA